MEEEVPRQQPEREGEGRAKPAREREGPNPDIREGKKGKCAALHFGLT